MSLQATVPKATVPKATVPKATVHEASQSIDGTNAKFPRESPASWSSPAFCEVPTYQKFGKLLASKPDQTIVVGFFGTPYLPRRTILPFMKTVATLNPVVTFASVNCLVNPQTARECNVTHLPTFQVFKNGMRLGCMAAGLDTKPRQGLIEVVPRFERDLVTFLEKHIANFQGRRYL